MLLPCIQDIIAKQSFRCFVPLNHTTLNRYVIFALNRQPAQSKHNSYSSIVYKIIAVLTIYNTKVVVKTKHC